LSHGVGRSYDKNSTMDKLLVGVALLLLVLGAACVGWALHQWRLGGEGRGLFWVGLGVMSAWLAQRLTAGEERT
jgi:hypothetical protein